MKQCKVRNCKRAHYGNGYCKLHYEHKRRYGRIFSEPRRNRSKTGICSVEGCNRKHHANGYCERHNRQVQEKGHIYGLINKTKFDPNAYEIEGNICKIFLCDERGTVKGAAMIDVSDMDRTIKRKWHLARTGYAVSDNLNMAPFIMRTETDKNIVIDHINQNKLDNRKVNLRITNKSINAFNTKMRVDNTSGYRGVSWDKEKNKWCARITINGKQRQIGRYSDIDDAISARKNAEREYQ